MSMKLKIQDGLARLKELVDAEEPTSEDEAMQKTIDAVVARLEASKGTSEKQEEKPDPLTEDQLVEKIAQKVQESMKNSGEEKPTPEASPFTPGRAKPALTKEVLANMRPDEINKNWGTVSEALKDVA